MLSLAIWIYLLLFHGRFWLVRDDAKFAGPALPRRVAVVIPARDEADVIGRAVASLHAQQYQGELSIFVVDDHSADDTAARACAASNRVTVVASQPLPAGWTGKMWAVSQGLEYAMAASPDYVLLTDADIEHSPRNIVALVARAERDQLDLASYMVRLATGTFAERATIPAFVFFFFKLYPPKWVAQPRYRTAGAAGGCMLVRVSALRRIDGVSRIRGALIDDCALAREIKNSGGRLWLGLSSETRSIRSYGTFSDISHMIARTAYTQLNHSVVMLAGAIAGMVLIYLVPPIAALSGSAYGAGAWAVMSLAYAPMLRFYRRSIFWAPLLPCVAAFYTGATIQSAIRYWRGRGGQWKGRAQDATSGPRA